MQVSTVQKVAIMNSKNYIHCKIWSEGNASQMDTINALSDTRAIITMLILIVAHFQISKYHCSYPIHMLYHSHTCSGSLMCSKRQIFYMFKHVYAFTHHVKWGPI